MADSGRLVKMEVDYSDAVERKLPEVQEMAKVWTYRVYDEYRCMVYLRSIVGFR